MEAGHKLYIVVVLAVEHDSIRMSYYNIMYYGNGEHMSPVPTSMHLGGHKRVATLLLLLQYLKWHI